METTITATQDAIKQLQGRARQRIVTTADLLQVLDEAQSDGWGNRSGGTVPNCYDYPAQRMRLAAIRKTNGDFAIWYDWGNAKRGSSNLPSELPRQYRKNNTDFTNELREFADNPQNIPDALIAKSTVIKVLRERRIAAAKKAAAGIHWSHPEFNGKVKREDSLNAGNCQQQTEKIIALLGVKYHITAQKLMRWITKNRPTLANYVDRAIIVAYNRQLS